MTEKKKSGSLPAIRNLGSAHWVSRMRENWGVSEDACLHLPTCVMETILRKVPFLSQTCPLDPSLVLGRRRWEKARGRIQAACPPSQGGWREGARALMAEAGLIPEAGFSWIVPANGSIPSGFCSANNLRQVLEGGKKGVICEA